MISLIKEREVIYLKYKGDWIIFILLYLNFRNDMFIPMSKPHMYIVKN